MQKLLFSGHSLNGIEKLRALGLHKGILPVLDTLFNDAAAKAFVVLVLQRTDERIVQDKGVSPAFLIAALFWPPMVQRWRALEAKGVRPLQAMHEAMDDVLDQQRKTLAIPRRLDPLIKELWLAQPRFLQRSQRHAYRTLSHPRFRASYDFYALRAEVGDAEKEISAWWERFQFAGEQEQETMLLPDDEPKNKKRRRRKKKTSGDGTEGNADISPTTPAPSSTDTAT